MTTKTLFSLGNFFAYTEKELRINGVLQNAKNHQSFCDFYKDAFVDGVFNENIFCQFYNIKKLKQPKLKVRNYLLNIITKEEYYNNLDAIKRTVEICGNCEDFLMSLALSVEYWDKECVNLLLDFGYKKTSPDIYFELLARELQVIIDKKLIS